MMPSRKLCKEEALKKEILSGYYRQRSFVCNDLFIYLVRAVFCYHGHQRGAPFLCDLDAFDGEWLMRESFRPTPSSTKRGSEARCSMQRQGDRRGAVGPYWWPRSPRHRAPSPARCRQGPTTP